MRPMEARPASVARYAFIRLEAEPRHGVPDVDVRFISPFLLAVATVFKTMVHMDVKVQKPRALTDPGTQADVSGVIGFSGDASGCVVLSFSTPVACQIASAFAGIPIDEKHPDFSDAIGELANMVAGNAKKDFEDMNISISLPSVIIGRGHTVSGLRACPRLAIPCETPCGVFEVEVAMVVTKAPAAAGNPSVAVPVA